jgi:8-oxo-dGTP diphosphatase
MEGAAGDLSGSPRARRPKQTWSGPDRRRPLSSHGQQEAAGLLIQLHQEPITRIVSSPALRCQQTVWPLARQRRLVVELDRRLDVDATAAQAAAMLLDPGVGDAVLGRVGESGVTVPVGWTADCEFGHRGV